MRSPARPYLRVLVAVTVVLAMASAGLAEALPGGNPANRLAALPIDDYSYDQARSCRKRPTACTPRDARSTGISTRAAPPTAAPRAA